MKFTVLDVEQRSDAWVKARLGRLTSSRAADMMATVKSGEAAGRRNLRVQLVLERLTGRNCERDFRRSAAMDHGVETEAQAVAAYEAITGCIIQRTGFIAHNELQVGCSLDGHFGDYEGVVEIKAPQSATHLEYVRSGRVPTEYLRQITHQLFVTGAEWADFMSFDPAFPESLQAKLVRVRRQDVDMPAYEAAARAFLAEVDRELEAVATLANLRGQLEQAVAVRA